MILTLLARLMPRSWAARIGDRLERFAVERLEKLEREGRHDEAEAWALGIAQGLGQEEIMQRAVEVNRRARLDQAISQSRDGDE